MIPSASLALLGLFFAVFGAASPAAAGEAAFSADGRQIFALAGPRSSGEGSLVKIDSRTGQRASFPLPRAIQARGELNSLARSKSGFLLLCFDDGLWAYDPLKQTSARVCKTEPGDVCYDVACDPATGQVLLASRRNLALAHDAKLQPISVRRVEQFRGLTALGEDCLLFSAGGDAWLGRIKDESEDAGRPFFTLLACRFAPVATLETGNYTPAQRGAAAFAVTAQWLYVHLLRMGGSGDGTLLRMPRPDPKMLDDEKVFFEPQERAQATAKVLGATEFLGANGYAAALCASPDGSVAFYQTTTDAGEQTSWLAKDGEAPRKLP